MPAILALPIRGRQAGTRALCDGQTSYRTNDTVQRAAHGKLTVPVAVVRTLQRRRSGRRQVGWLVDVGLRVPDPVGRIRARDRRRFGIESG